MNKFTRTLSASNDTIRKERAENLSEEVILEVDTLIGKLKKEKVQLKNKIANLTDLAPDNTYSLRPGGEDFVAADWVSELHGAKMDLDFKTIELQTAEDIKKEWFTDEDEDKN